MDVTHILQMQMLNIFQGLINIGHNQIITLHIHIHIHARRQHRNTKLKENTFQLTIIYYLYLAPNSISVRHRCNKN